MDFSGEREYPTSMGEAHKKIEVCIIIINKQRHLV